MCFQGQVLDVFGATSGHVGLHLWKQAPIVEKSSQDTSELLSEDAAGFKDNSASALNTLVKYLNLHGLTLGPSVGGKSRRITLWIFPSSSSPVVPICPPSPKTQDLGCYSQAEPCWKPNLISSSSLPSAAHLKVDVGIPAAQNKGALPFLPPPALCWVLRHHTELILISCLNSPCVLAVLCHQTVTSVLGWECLARSQCETRVIVIIYYYIFTGQKRCLQHAEPQGCKDLLNRHIWCWENFHQQDLGPNRQVSNEGYWCFWGLRSFASPLEGERGCFLFGVSWHFLVPDKFQQYSVPKAGSKTHNSSNQVHVGM